MKAKTLIKEHYLLEEFDSKTKHGLKLSATVTLTKEELIVSYLLEGRLDSISLPDITSAPHRALELWESTCFELFLKNSKLPSVEEYFEFNFSPSTQWNCFHFLKYRGELREYPGLINVKIKSSNKEELAYELVARIKRSQLPKELLSAKLQLSLTAVITSKGEKSYWACRHCDKGPNFHHPNSYLWLDLTD